MEHQYIIQGERGYEFHDDIDKREKTELVVKEVNKLSNLPCKLLEHCTSRLKNKLAEKEFGELHNFMSTDFESEDAVVICSGYPHDEEKDRVTMICYKTDKYDFLGIKIGQILKESFHTLESYGYRLNKDKDDTFWEKDDVRVFVEGELFVEELRAEVKTFYLGNRIY